MNQSEVFFALARPVDSHRYSASILGHELELTRRGPVDPCLLNGQCVGTPVHYLPDGLARDSLHLVADGGRISFELENQYDCLPAAGGFPADETYGWQSRGRLDGWDVLAGLPNDAPPISIAGEPIRCLLLMAAHLDPAGDERQFLIEKSFEDLVYYLEPFDDPEPWQDDREYRELWARLLARRSAPWEHFFHTRIAALERHADRIAADLADNPPAVEEEAPTLS